MLQQICKSTQMGQSGIRAVFTGAREPAMKQALASQLREYDAIHHQADRLLRDRGESAQRIPGLVLAASRMGAQMRLARAGSSSKTAADRADQYRADEAVSLNMAWTRS